jgi:beta-lactamase superfamily II metal-dependent hydrolase
MIFTIHDVGLGQFITLEHEDGHTMVWDAGDSDTFDPATYLKKQGITTIDRFFITNFDQDHVSGLGSLKSLKIRCLYRNNLVDAEALRRMKLDSGTPSTAMEEALAMHRDWNGKLTDLDLINFPNHTHLSTFCNRHSDTISDTNNLSLVTVIKYKKIKIVICGDMERKGWQELINNHANFLNEISQTDIFIASHHGRENGYHEAVMRAASPQVVIMSDYEVKHATQESLQLYRKDCRGIIWNGAPRHILTTRRDGTIRFDL